MGDTTLRVVAVRHLITNLAGSGGRKHANSDATCARLLGISSSFFEQRRDAVLAWVASRRALAREAA